MRATLYQRLTPEALEALEYNSKRWRGTADKKVNKLSSHKFWSDLTVGDVNSIILFVDLPFAKITTATFKFGENIIKDED